MIADTREMARLTKGLPSKSEKMRVLAYAGYARSDIARFLGTRYQFVRNVLEHEKAKQSAGARLAPAAGESGGGEPADHDHSRPLKVRLGPDGQVTVPVGMREALGLREGQALVLVLENDEIHLLTKAAAVRRARALVRQFVPEGTSLVDELLEERRREAEREEQNV